MKKLMRNLLLLTAAASLLCGMGLFAACGETENGGQNEDPNAEKVAYSVTVLDPAGLPLPGIGVKLGSVATVYNTLENGKITANLEAKEYEISLVNLPVIYKYSAVKVSESEREKTVSLQWNPEEGKVVYTVRVLLPDGTPVKGAWVELCLASDSSGTCTSFPVLTNEKGESYSMGAVDEESGVWLLGLSPATYKAKVLSGIPTGYTYEMDGEQYYLGGTATAENTTLVITLTEN